VPAATDVSVPDLGDFSEVPVIEIHVAAGDVVSAEDPLITLESDKATMDIPSPAAGTVRELRVSVGDLVSKGSSILLLEPGAADGPPAEPAAPAEPAGSAPPAGSADPAGSNEPAGSAEPELPVLADPSALADQQEPPTLDAPDFVAAAQEPARRSAAAAPPPATQTSAPVTAVDAGPPADFAGVHAGPGVRRLARELGVDLTAVTGTGPKGRVTKEDLLASVRGRDGAPPSGAVPPGGAGPAAAGSGIPEIPAQDFAKFGPVEIRPLSRIQRLSGPQLHRSWLNIPHVTQNDEADITDLDEYRRELDGAARADGYRVTLLSFLLKASVSALREYPKFNSSLTPEKDALIYKSYYNIGVAVDTPDGLIVPVIRDVDRKGIRELSQELGEVSAKAREGKLGLTDLQGGCFTISSLGGIGGTSFTPIVNAPEVAILGVVRARMAPVWDGSQFIPRLMLPVSLSYDHRVIDGALAARFARHLCHLLEDIRRLVL
jgi:pyruvate dehydrogenase E2 component (dihydrolipoamide acetyltransferase)